MPSVRRPTFVRAFLPFWITLVWGALALMGDYHVRQAPLTRLPVQVTVEGQRPDEGFTVEVNGQRQDPDGPVPLGSAKIRIFAPDTEPKLVERFIWYGVTDLGSVDLTRSRGSLVAKVSPPPEGYELTGKRGNWTNATGSFESVTAGSYELTSRFGSLSRRTAVRVKGNQTERLNLAAEIGALELVSEPAEGEFELWSSALNVRRTGTFPATIPWLPSGPYQLVAKRPGYQREQKVEVRRNETNRIVVKFTYGSAKIATTPAGASVTWAGTESGTTPANLNKIVPGRYPLEVRLAGYDRVSKEVDVEGDATVEVVLTLVNTRYREAMEGAYRNQQRNRFAAAAEDLEAALAAQPGDPTATKLLPGIRARALRDRAEAAAQNGDFQGALTALEAALKTLPEDPETIALQAKYRTAKAEDDQKQTEARFRQLLTEAKSEAERQDFKKALAVLDEAKKEWPDRPELVELEAALQKGLTKMELDAAEKRRADEIAARPSRFKAAWERAISNDPEADSSPLNAWRTTKSAADVRAALERIGTAETKLKVSEVTADSADIFTAKLGALSPAFGLGRYMRVGVATYKEGDTRIRLKIFLIEKGINARSPDSRADSFRDHAEWLRKRLVEELGADVNKT